jgi:hypothetical protein
MLWTPLPCRYALHMYIDLQVGPHFAVYVWCDAAFAFLIQSVDVICCQLHVLHSGLLCDISHACQTYRAAVTCQDDPDVISLCV